MRERDCVFVQFIAEDAGFAIATAGNRDVSLLDAAQRENQRVEIRDMSRNAQASAKRATQKIRKVVMPALTEGGT